MQTEAVGSAELAVVAGDVLALRGAGLAAPETWALLCQAAQALQDLFLSTCLNETTFAFEDGKAVRRWRELGGKSAICLTVVGVFYSRYSLERVAIRKALRPSLRPDEVKARWLPVLDGGVVGGSGMGPVVTPHTIELTPRGRVTLQLASPETARAYLPPEYRPGRLYSDTDSEKMWMYSLGRALLDTTPRVAALTGSVSVSPSSALQSVLAAMTEPDPRRRASLMNLLDVISEYCRTRLQSKPFTHIVMDMYREVVRSPRYSARKRAALPALRPVIAATQRHQRQNPHQAQSPDYSLHSHIPKQHQLQHQHTGHFSKHQVKGALFKAQSRNSRSHPNLLSLSGQEPTLSSPKPQFQSQMDIQTSNAQQPAIRHARTISQPEYSERVKRELTGHTRSAHNIAFFSNGQRAPQASRANVYSDPIYALPVKPFLSSQDVRVNGLSAKPAVSRNADFNDETASGKVKIVHNGGSSQPNIAHLTRASNGDILSGKSEDIRGKGSVGRNTHPITAQSLHRQFSNPQLPTKDVDSFGGLRHYSRYNAIPTRLRIFNNDSQIDDGDESSTNPVSSTVKVSSLHGPVPPKPPRVMTCLRRSAAPLPESSNGPSESVPPVKPPRTAIKNGPRARRGKPVQRAPSRLYRAIGGPTRCFNKTQCVGPEFVVRANQPPKILCVGDAKASSSGRIVVILLTGQRIEVTCDPQKITAGELFQVQAFSEIRDISYSECQEAASFMIQQIPRRIARERAGWLHAKTRLYVLSAIWISLSAIVQAEGLDENFTLGLAALLAGDFAMLPPETKLNKVSPPGWSNTGKSKGTLGLPTSFMLYLRFRFFLPSLRGIRSWISKHLLYLQIRRCILEQQLVCPLAQLVNLTGLALQAEFGNYSVNEHGRGDYFLLEHYIPESLILNPDLDLQQQWRLSGGAEALRAQLHQAHRDRRGLDANNAEEMFISHAQALVDYGSHYYIATVDNKELEKIMARLKKSKANRSPSSTSESLYGCTENIYQVEATTDCPMYGKIQLNRFNSCDNNGERSVYNDEQKRHVLSGMNDDVYDVPATPSAVNIIEANNNGNRLNRSKKSECNVWLAIHAQGLKLFERGGRPRDRTELTRLQWRDIQTLSYSKNSLVVYTRFNGKRCKFKLRMDHKKSFYAFKLTSLHHQFFLKLRSELTSLHGLAKDFGIPLISEANSPASKSKLDVAKSSPITKSPPKSKYPMQLEEYQNKENENPQKNIDPLGKSDETDTEPVCYTPEEDALYAQVNARLEPEGASRDTEDESERALTSQNGHVTTVEISQPHRMSDNDKLYSYPAIGLGSEKESLYSIPKQPMPSADDIDRLNGELIKHPEELYAAINKTGQSKKNSGYPVPDEVWDVANSKKSLHKVKTSSLPNYGTPRQSTGFRTPSLPRRLGVKMGTRVIYSSLIQRDSSLADDLESLSVKSDTASSIQSTSAQSSESPAEAYVLNADIRTDDETFRIGSDETMSASLAARLEELSFVEERILQTIQLERGHGGSIGLQVTEGNDGGVYVQAVSVGGSADMAGNVNKGDRIVAINGQSLLNLRYEEALKMLQSSSATVELVLSQITNNRRPNTRKNQEPTESTDYLHNLRFEISLEGESSSMTTKWLSQRATDVASVQNTSSAYSSAASSAMGNHNTYLTDVTATNALNSAMESGGGPPPVPPRRRKRNVVPTKPKVATIAVKEDTGRVVAAARPDRKPRSPPPPVPVKNLPRERKPRVANKTESRTTIPNISSGEHLKNSPMSLNAIVHCETKKSPRFIVTEKPDSLNVENFFNNDNMEYRNENRSGRTSPMPKDYSPLFFTLEDFESVMENSALSDRSPNDQYDSIEAETCGPASISSFLENSIAYRADDEDYDEPVCFRVTTTSVPFEKSLDARWSFSIDGNCDGNCDGNTDNFIFDDYIDRSRRLNGRSTFLFDDDTFEASGITRSATKVRFVIESPSSSTPDTDLEETSVGNVESDILDDAMDNRKTSIIITEIIESNSKEASDEFGQVPFDSLVDGRIDGTFGKNYEEFAASSDSKVEAEFKSPMIDQHTPPRSTPSPRFRRPEILDRNDPIPDIDEVLVPELPITYDPREEGFVRKEADLSRFDTDRKIAREAFVNGKFRLSFGNDENDGSPWREKEKKKIFIDSSLRDFIDNEEEMEWSSEEEGYSAVFAETKVPNRDTCRDDEGASSKLSIVDKEERKKLASYENAKDESNLPVPVSVRRNSFLENMLADDETRVMKDIIPCSIIAAHPKLIRSDDDVDESPKGTKEVRNESGVRVVGTSPSVVEQGVATGVEEEKKRDVLSELLCNFGAIRLKSVEPRKRRDTNLSKLDRVEKEISSESSNSSSSETRTEGDSDKTDRRIEKNVKSIDEKSATNDKRDDSADSFNDHEEKRSLKNDEAMRVDKCAIDIEINPPIRRNNNDNNAMTPVDLSYDQKSRDAEVAIAPGSVRSFVELYEIQRERTSKHSKSIYSLPVLTPRFEDENDEAIFNDNYPLRRDVGHESQTVKAFERANYSSYQGPGAPVAAERFPSQPSPDNSTDDTTKPKFKRRAPEKPATAQIEDTRCAIESIGRFNRQINPTTETLARNPTPAPRSDINLHRSQIQQSGLKDDADATIKTGIASSLLKSNVPRHLQQPRVFYCRL